MAVGEPAGGRAGGGTETRETQRVLPKRRPGVGWGRGVVREGLDRLEHPMHPLPTADEGGVGDQVLDRV